MILNEAEQKNLKTIQAHAATIQRLSETSGDEERAMWSSIWNRYPELKGAICEIDPFSFEIIIIGKVEK